MTHTYTDSDRVADKVHTFAKTVMRMEPNDGIFTALTCGEAEEWADLFHTAGEHEAAQEVIARHAKGDDSGDEHWAPHWKDCETDDDVSALMAGHESSFAGLGRFVATYLGSVQPWPGADMLESIAETAANMLGPDFPHPGSDSPDGHKFWGLYAPTFGIEPESEE